jgi:uncharacterized protein YdiU (UPF0061 family)
MATTAADIVAFSHSYVRDVPALTLPWTAAAVEEPQLLVLNDELAAELGLDAQALREPSGLALLVGNGVPDTVAMAYAGHQFGHYSPRLGDGRALLLGELVDTAGRRRDLHLKGSGRTPFARGGDGFAVVGPMLREYLISEAMHALGIPTTRSLAVIGTGRTVRRERLLPGAVLARVAASHIRVGTFQYAAATGDHDLLRALADHAIARHHPDAAHAENPYLDLFRRVMAAQASLVARWMLVGFVHGVMNTDNVTISGETIDYGPCAFMDAVDPRTVFSSIDETGRYAYGNQPAVTQWNFGGRRGRDRRARGIRRPLSLRPAGRHGREARARPGRPTARGRPSRTAARTARRSHQLLPSVGFGHRSGPVPRPFCLRRVGGSVGGLAARSGRDGSGQPCLHSAQPPRRRGTRRSHCWGSRTVHSDP